MTRITRITAGLRAFSSRLSITQRDASLSRSRSGVRAWRLWWARCPSMLRANGTAVAARSRLTRRAPYAACADDVEDRLIHLVCTVSTCDLAVSYRRAGRTLHLYLTHRSRT